VLVWPRGGDPGDVARSLERDHRLTVRTREQFSGHERQVVSDMSNSLISRQSLLTVLGDLGLALILVVVLAVGVPLLEPSVNVAVSAGSVARTAGAAALIPLLAAFVPARRVARVDPASVYIS
jgi:hypothetical protein